MDSNKNSSRIGRWPKLKGRGDTHPPFFNHFPYISGENIGKIGRVLKMGVTCHPYLSIQAILLRQSKHYWMLGMVHHKWQNKDCSVSHFSVFMKNWKNRHFPRYTRCFLAFIEKFENVKYVFYFVAWCTAGNISVSCQIQLVRLKYMTYDARLFFFYSWQFMMLISLFTP